MAARPFRTVRKFFFLIFFLWRKGSCAPLSRAGGACKASPHKEKNKQIDQFPKLNFQCHLSPPRALGIIIEFTFYTNGITFSDSYANVDSNNENPIKGGRWIQGMMLTATGCMRARMLLSSVAGSQPRSLIQSARDILSPSAVVNMTLAPIGRAMRAS